jgi:hypothetical protein
VSDPHGVQLSLATLPGDDHAIRSTEIEDVLHADLAAARVRGLRRQPRRLFAAVVPPQARRAGSAALVRTCRPHRDLTATHRLARRISGRRPYQEGGHALEEVRGGGLPYEGSFICKGPFLYAAGARRCSPRWRRSTRRTRAPRAPRRCRPSSHLLSAGTGTLWFGPPIFTPPLGPLHTFPAAQRATIDFESASTIRLDGGEAHPFAPLGRAVQDVVACGGTEAWVKAQV